MAWVKIVGDGVAYDCPCPNPDARHAHISFTRAVELGEALTAVGEAGLRRERDRIAKQAAQLRIEREADEAWELVQAAAIDHVDPIQRAMLRAILDLRRTEREK